jgi:hypothetical protein
MSTKNPNENPNAEKNTAGLTLKIKRVRTRLAASVKTGYGGGGGCCGHNSVFVTDPYGNPGLETSAGCYSAYASPCFNKTVVAWTICP